MSAQAPTLPRPLVVLRRHAAAVAVLVTGLLVRVVYELAYPHAFLFPDSQGYLDSAHNWYFSALRPYGYSLFLKFLHASPDAAAITQHLLGLGLAVLGYALLVRRGVTAWIGALAIAPLALFPMQITIEHYVLAELLFTLAVALSLGLLVWWPRVSVWVAAASGALLLYGAVTRLVGLPLCLLVPVYLLLRRVGWRVLAAFGLAMVLPLGAYLARYHHLHGVYALNQYQGRFLYSRAMMVADCEHLRLTPEQRQLCVDGEPIRSTGRSDHYIWADASPARIRYLSPIHDPFLRSFAIAVISQQPGDYAWLVLRETTWHLRPNPPLPAELQCLRRSWLPPDPSRACNPYPLNPSPAGAHSLRPLLVRYAPLDNLTGLILGGGLLFTVGTVALVAVRRRSPLRIGQSHSTLAPLLGPSGPAMLTRRDAGDALLFATTGLTLLVVSVATSTYEPRYAVPALVFIPLGAALISRRS